MLTLITTKVLVLIGKETMMKQLSHLVKPLSWNKEKQTSTITGDSHSERKETSKMLSMIIQQQYK
jgi:ubiquinone biosynthesis protein UbiJ